MAAGETHEAGMLVLLLWEPGLLPDVALQDTWKCRLLLVRILTE